MDHARLQLGACPRRAGGAEFLVWAPRAAAVELQFAHRPGAGVPLTACGDGYWTGLVEAAAGTRYAYSLDGGPPRPDPASRLQPDGVNQPSAVVDPAFEWHDAAWRGMSLAGAVVYELHVGTFTPAGTFDAAVAELDALIDLGVTAIELMPVAQFPGERNWGYDGVHPFAVQNSYGGPAGLKRLVDACHGRGLGVALDVVYNHFGPEGNYLAEFGPYFTPRHQTPWGPAVNFEGPESDPVRRFFIDNALMWIGEFHVDALRLDAIHAIVDQSANPFLAELAAAVHSCAAQLGRPAWLIAENNRNDPRIFAPAQAGGYALDAQWLDDFGRALQALLTGDRAGFYADFGRAADLAKAWRHGYVLSGQTSRYRGRRHGADSSAVPCERLLAYAQCHDQVGNRPRSDRLSTQVDFDALRLAAAALLLSPYPALLFMGEEYGEPAPFHYFVSHLDPDLVERVRAGRRCEFAAFRWPTEPADPQAESTFAASKLDLSLRHDPRHRPLWDCYRELIRLRRELLTHTEPRAGSRVESSEQPRVLVSTRRGPGVEIAVVLHLAAASDSLAPLEFLAGRLWQKQFDSRDPRWGAPGGAAPDVWDPACPLPLGPWAAMVYQRER